MKKVWIDEGGKIAVREEREPELRPRWVLTDTQYSLISSGTETTHIKGMASADAAGSAPRRVGYSNSGVVRTCGEGVEGVSSGDLVACYGGGFADHQTVCAVPQTLVATAPVNVTARQAAFAGVATFGINGLRLCDLSFGDTVAVIGLGLLGQMTLQAARGAGYRVVGLNRSQERLDQAEALGFSALVRAARPNTVAEALEMAQALGAAPDEPGRRGGFDAVVICAGGGDSNAALLTALELVRDRGVISIVGNSKLDFPRGPFFEREARLVIARAAGVGRYDPHHEEDAEPIPHSYVRWTEGRNVAEALRMMGDGTLNVDALISHEFAIEDAAAAYDVVLSGSPSTSAVLLRHSDAG